MRIDKLAVWINTIGYASADLVAFARRLEDWGYGTLWINDGMGSDPMVLAARILAGTDRLQVALGVANIYSRDPTMMLHTSAYFATRRNVLRSPDPPIRIRGRGWLTGIGLQIVSASW